MSFSSMLSLPGIDVAVQFVVLPLVAGGVTGLFAFLFRLHTGKAIPEGPALLIGLGTLSLILNTRVALVQFVGAAEYTLSPEQVVTNLLLLTTAGLTATGGRYIGTRLATSVGIPTRIRSLTLPAFRGFGQTRTVKLPERIEDIDGYDPVPEETRTILEGLELEFPRGLTTDALSEQLTARLKDEHLVGYVDIELSSEGDIEYLAVGRRAATLGATLPPGYRAVAIQSDPPFSASPGDTVQIWRSSADAPGGVERIGTGELRAAVDTTTTIVVDEDVVADIDPREDHRLMTLSADSRVDRVFASMLRQADETMSVIEVSPDSILADTPLGGFEVSIIAVRTQDGEIETLPSRDRVLRAGESVYAIGLPAVLRQLEAELTAEGD